MAKRIVTEEEARNHPKKNVLLKQRTSIIDTIGLIIYLLWSFATGAWYITWILWIIVGIIDQIVRLLFTLNTKEEDINEVIDNE